MDTLPNRFCLEIDTLPNRMAHRVWRDGLGWWGYGEVARRGGRHRARVWRDGVGWDGRGGDGRKKPRTRHTTKAGTLRRGGEGKKFPKGWL